MVSCWSGSTKKKSRRAEYPMLHASSLGSDEMDQHRTQIELNN